MREKEKRETIWRGTY